MVYFDSSSYSEALEYLNDATKIYLKNFSEAHEDVADTYFNIAQVYFEQKKYSDCVSKVAQITLSAPLFSTAQYVNAFAFFKQNKLERAAEIFGGMFQYESMYKNLNREELGWMNVYTRYLMFQKNESDVQKKALDNAIDSYLEKIDNSEGVFYNKVITLKGFL